MKSKKMKMEQCQQLKKTVLKMSLLGLAALVLQFASVNAFAEMPKAVCEAKLNILNQQLDEMKYKCTFSRTDEAGGGIVDKECTDQYLDIIRGSYYNAFSPSNPDQDLTSYLLLHFEDTLSASDNDLTSEIKKNIKAVKNSLKKICEAQKAE